MTAPRTSSPPSPSSPSSSSSTMTPRAVQGFDPRPRRRDAAHQRRSLRLMTLVVLATAIAWPLTVAARAQTGATTQKASKKTMPATTSSISTQPVAPKSQAHTIDLPFEKLAYEKSALPGYQLTLQQCSACHSPEYVAYQPRTSSRAYWQATVDKMVKTFGAPLPAEQVAPIVEYLTKTYGAEAAGK